MLKKFDNWLNHQNDFIIGVFVISAFVMILSVFVAFLLACLLVSVWFLLAIPLLAGGILLWMAFQAVRGTDEPN